MKQKNSELFKQAAKHIEKGEIDNFTSLLGSHPELLNEVNHNGHSLLHIAASKNKKEFIKFLVEGQGGPINYLNNHFNTVLDIAEKKVKNPEITAFLQAKGAKKGSEVVESILKNVAMDLGAKIQEKLFNDSGKTEERKKEYKELIQNEIIFKALPGALDFLKQKLEFLSFLVSKKGDLVGADIQSEYAGITKIIYDNTEFSSPIGAVVGRISLRDNRKDEVQKKVKGYFITTFNEYWEETKEQPVDYKIVDSMISSLNAEEQKATIEPANIAEMQAIAETIDQEQKQVPEAQASKVGEMHIEMLGDSHATQD